MNVPILRSRSARSSLSRWRDISVVGLDELASGWKSLAEIDPTPTSDLAWATAVELAAVDGTPTACVVVGDTRAPEAIAPMRHAAGRGSELGLSAMGEPVDVLFRDPAALAALCDGLAALRVPIKLWRLPAASPTYAALARAYRGRGVVLRRVGPTSPVLRLDKRWTEPEGCFNAGRRSDIRRARRRAEAAGPTSVEVLAPKPAEVDALMADALAVEAAGWKGRAGTALATDRERGDFFRTWANLAARDGTLRMAFLRIDGRAVAMQIAAEIGNRLWLLKIGYDEEFARCSPGFLLMLEVVRRAAHRSFQTVELLGRSEAWTAVWSTEERQSVGVAAYPVSISGAAGLVRDAAHVARARARARAKRTDPDARS